jgi:hypothetical protein
MDAQLLEFARQVLDLGLNPVPLVLALGLVRLIGGKLQALLLIVNLWLVMELAATLLAPGYRFGDLLLPRLVATGLEVAIAHGGLHWWRHRRSGDRSVAAH